MFQFQNLDDFVIQDLKFFDFVIKLNMLIQFD